MYQLPVNNLARIRKARKQVKRNLEDIGLEFCKEAAEEFKEFCPDEQTVKDSAGYDILTWDPSNSKTQGYRSKQFCCTVCRFSSKYYSGYKNHFRNVHRTILESQLLINCPYCAFSANRRTLETHVKIFHITNSFQLNYGNPRASVLGSSAVQGNRLERPMYFCKKCKFRDTLYNVVRRHIYREHFQHIVSPYYGRVSGAVKNGACSVNGNNIFCKQCPFSTRSYEALVQHVVEYHERIGSQVTTMIGHANIAMSKPQPTMNEKAVVIINKSKAPTPAPTAQPVIGYLKPTVKSQRSVPPTSKSVKVNANGAVAENNQTGVNTAQTQKWKICTVCNELFPENLYSAHFECAHKAKKVWAMAKYIMKIHNFTSKCLLCNRYLPSSTLLNHMLIHGLTCPQCHCSFHSIEKIMEHKAKTHPDDFVRPSSAAPLTFDLTVKQSKPTNIQLAVLTFNMKESPNSQEQSPSAYYLPLPEKVQPVRIMEKQSEPRGMVSLIQNSDVGKTVCPLCFSILKGPISEALSMHLRQRHQVIQTMHPVENKMTYKCIHCLGVYTSNMVASTITLHLVQCRAVGRSQSSQFFKSSLTLNSAGAGVLKRQLATQSPSNPKKIKMSKGTGPFRGCAAPFDGLVLDPSGCEHKTHEARKEFLTAYFNRRPYPTSQEVEKLAASLWLWKSEVASHFALKRKLCLKSCETKKVSVEVGLDMTALSKLKHYLIFDKGRLVGTSSVRCTGLKRNIPHSKPKRRPHSPNRTVQHSGLHIEIISIDSDNEEETEDPVPIEEVDTSQKKNENVDKNSGVDVDYKCLENQTEEEEHVEMADPLQEKDRTPDEQEGDQIQVTVLSENDNIEPNQKQDISVEDEKIDVQPEEDVLQIQKVEPNLEMDILEDEKVDVQPEKDVLEDEKVVVQLEMDILEDEKVDVQPEKDVLEDEKVDVQPKKDVFEDEKVVVQLEMDVFEDEKFDVQHKKDVLEDEKVEVQLEMDVFEDEKFEVQLAMDVFEDEEVDPNQEEDILLEEDAQQNLEEEDLENEMVVTPQEEHIPEKQNVDPSQEQVVLLEKNEFQPKKMEEVLENENRNIDEEIVEYMSPESLTGEHKNENMDEASTETSCMEDGKENAGMTLC